MRKKVVIIINNFAVGGAERFFLNILPRLDKKKVKLYLVTVWGSGPLEENYFRLDIPIYFAGTKVRFKKNLLLKLYLTIIAPVTLIKLLIILHKIQPDIVVTCLCQADILGTLAAWLSRVKKRIIRQPDIKSLHPFIKCLKKAFGFNLATDVIANSQTTKQFLINYFGVFPEKIMAIPNGINISQFTKGVTPVKMRDNLTLGFVGRLEPVKGVQYLLDALNLLKKKYNLIPKTILIGDGSLRHGFEHYVRSNNLSNLHFTGATTNVADALKRIDILIIPSLSEGFGLVVLEGLVAGRIVVASDLPVIRDLIINGKNGVLFTVADSQSLAAALFKVITDKLFFQQLCQGIDRWQHHEMRRFDINNIAQRYESFILS